MTLEQAIDLGFEYLRTGRLAEAEAVCRQVLSQYPSESRALHLLGIVSGQAGRPDVAVELIRRAIDVAPGVAEYHNDLAESYRRLEQWDKSVSSLRRAIELKPGLTLAHKNLGRLLYAQGRLDEAISAYRRAMKLAREDPEIHNTLGTALNDRGSRIEAIAAYRCAIKLRPDYAEAHSNLGNVLDIRGQFDEAIAAHQRAVELRPDVAAFHNNLGNAWRNAGRPGEAAASYQRAIGLDPSLAVVHSNLGTSLAEMDRLDEAIAAHRRAIELLPTYADAYYKLALTLGRKGQVEEAIAALRRTIELAPAFIDAYNWLGVYLHQCGRLDEAIDTLSQAIALAPSHLGLHNNLGNALNQRGRIDEAIAALRREIELNPRSAEAHNNLGKTFRDQGCLDEALTYFRQAVAVRPDYSIAASNLVHTVHYHPDYDAQALLRESRQWARQFAEPLAAQIQPHTNDRTPDRKLRIGYISPDFRNHAVGRMLQQLFAHHDRSQVEIIAYSHVAVSEALTTRLQASADAWRDIVNLADAKVAERIREDRIDILVDLALHTANNRLLVLARKPAPVQLSMLGMPSTTGLTTIDYRLTDPYLDPPGTPDDDYTERTVRLPHCAWCYEAMEGTPPVGELPALTNRFVTFGCMNQPSKLSRPALQLWIRVLEAVPGSRLVIHLDSGRHRDVIRALFRDGGIAEDRLEFVGLVSLLQYLENHNNLDLCLDPFPYNGHTTTLDALWMGVPVITLAGRTGVGRGGVSLLSNAGLPELIATTPEQYVETAVRWATDWSGLAALRAGLRDRMIASPLMDGRRYAADVEAAYRQMWTTWCRT